MQKNKSIALVNPTFSMRRPISDIAIILQKKGHDVAIVSPKYSGRKFHHQTKLKSIKHISYRAYDMFSSFEFPIPTFTFFREIHTIRNYDNVHIWTNSYISCFLITFYVRIKNPKAQLIISMDTVLGESFKFNNWLDTAYYLFNRTIGRMLIAYVDTITLYGKSFVPYLQRITRKKPHITPTGIEPEKADALPDQLAKTMGTRPHGLFIGIIGKRKGIDILIKIAQQMPQVTFLVVGNSKQRAYYEKISPKNMIYLGKITYVIQLLKKVDFLILPTRGEGLCGVIMEAMLYKCPVISNKITGNTDLIPSKKEGYLISNNSVSGYKKAIQEILSKKKNVTNNAYKHIRKQYSWKNIKHFEKIYTCAE